MAEQGQRPIWDGSSQTTPWWWPYILQLEKRLESLRETAAYDPDKQPPPKDLWPLHRHKDLDDYLESRRKEDERRRREKPPLDDWG